MQATAAIAIAFFTAIATPLAAQAPQPSWSTYLGGAGSEHPAVHGVLSLPNGHLVVVGATSSNNFPTRHAIQPTYGGGTTDGFVACLDPTAAGTSQLLWSTYLGGADQDEVTGVTEDPSTGDLIVCGFTGSLDFPVTNGVFQGAAAGGLDMFVARLAWNGQSLALQWSTHLGSGGNEAAAAVAVHLGSVYVAGSTDSATFPLAGTPWQSGYGGGALDGVVAKLDGAGRFLGASTYVGGVGTDSVTDLVVDQLGRLVVVGQTTAAFPVTPGAFQSVYGGGTADGFVCWLGPQLDAAFYSTMLGRAGHDAIHAAVTVGNSVCVGGFTGPGSTVFPTTDGSTFAGGPFDAFVCMLDPIPGPAALAWSTLFGGNQSDGVHDIAVQPSGLVTVVGSSNSTNLPCTIGAHSPTYRGGARDAFVLSMDPQRRTGVERLYASYWGGSGTDEGFAVAVDARGDVVLAGQTDSLSLPSTAAAYQPNFGGGAADIVLAVLPMLPAGVGRFGENACAATVAIHVNSAPTKGNALFTVFATGAPAASLGVIAFGTPAAPVTLPWPGACLLLGNPVTFVSRASASGFATWPLPLPVTLASPFRVGVQWLFLDPAGFVAASPGLKL